MLESAAVRPPRSFSADPCDHAPASERVRNERLVNNFAWSVQDRVDRESSCSVASAPYGTSTKGILFTHPILYESE